MQDVTVMEGTAGEWEIEIISPTDERGACWMRMSLPQWEIVSSGDYRSIAEASSDLQCTVGLQGAMDFLATQQVAHTSRWWHLNHNNPHI